MPSLLPREILRDLSVSLLADGGLPLLTIGSASPDQVTRLHIGSLSLRPASLPLGNSQPPVTRTLLPGAKKVYGQLLSRDFNPLEKQPITAYGQFSLCTVIVKAFLLSAIASQLFPPLRYRYFHNCASLHPGSRETPPPPLPRLYQTDQGVSPEINRPS